MSAALDAARDLFIAVTGHAPDGLWSAPGRVNLIGEHTDYNDGFVLPFAIPQRTVAAVGLRDDDRIRVASTFADDQVVIGLDELDRLFPTAAGEQPAVPEWSAYPLGVAWALRAASGSTGRGVDIAIASEVPVGAGLSSSAAIEGAVASALDELWGTGLDPVALARIGRTAENDAVGAPTGIMDQMASMLGEADAALFLDCRTLDSRVVPLDMAEAELSLLVIDTRVKHTHSTGGYRERRESCENGARLLGVAALRDVSVADLARARELMDDVTFRRVRHVVTENQRVLDAVRVLDDVGAQGYDARTASTRTGNAGTVQAQGARYAGASAAGARTDNTGAGSARPGNPRTESAQAVGDLLTASHVSMRDDFEISTPELDAAVDTALAAGALGARMTGGGFGGAAIALVPHDAVTAVSDAVRARFEEAGFAEPHLFPVHPSAGPRRDA